MVTVCQHNATVRHIRTELREQGWVCNNVLGSPAPKPEMKRRGGRHQAFSATRGEVYEYYMRIRPKIEALSRSHRTGFRRSAPKLY